MISMIMMNSMTILVIMIILFIDNLVYELNCDLCISCSTYLGINNGNFEDDDY